MVVLVLDKKRSTNIPPFPLFIAAIVGDWKAETGIDLVHPPPSPPVNYAANQPCVRTAAHMVDVLGSLRQQNQSHPPPPPPTPYFAPCALHPCHAPVIFFDPPPPFFLVKANFHKSQALPFPFIKPFHPKEKGPRKTCFPAKRFFHTPGSFFTLLDFPEIFSTPCFSPSLFPPFPPPRLALFSREF